ncbi:dienelactone hydrolase family protein [Sphingomonas jatrophae]|uniref:Carboxymethylenebutenolidase n=1 Tax=Sphingomonas jatrophae TaxID=1166337 RepID=A0A1I6JZ26_9SPHN|nr:dienelactone hydrolase family protein [Sphingomonas jatrophae]SFR84201.1 carboxymethylenebutenolidase [Sphingomonas jatrophae]
MPRIALDLPADGGTIDATLHLPEGSGPWPKVLMLTDIRGPRDAFYGMADRLAGQGYAVLLPNVYWRLGRAPVPDLSADPNHPDTFPNLLKLKATLTPEVMRADAVRFLDALEARTETMGGAMGVVGYCMSGPYAIYAAEAGGERVAAAAAYHSAGLIVDGEDSPHRIAARVSAALVFGHGDKDETLPEARLPELDRMLAEARRDFVNEVYAGSPHGFAVPGSARYDEAGAERHWRTMTQLFGRCLK